MNRQEEYQKLLNMDVPAATQISLERAKRRQKRRALLLRPVSTLCSVFLCFVLLVNFCEPVALACARVPGLRELAAAVTFSRSLTDAVYNEYGQPIELEQTRNGITARVEHLIVDQKQVTIFLRIDSEEYERLNIEPRFKAGDGSSLAGYSYGSNDYDVPNGQLQSVTIDFIDGTVPESLLMELGVYPTWSLGTVYEEPAESVDFWDTPDYEEPEYIAEFEFLLEYDPLFTETSKQMTLNETIVLDDQTMTITDVEIFPSFMSLTVKGAEENTAWLRDLDFYVVTDTGERFDTVTNGISATGDPDTPAMITYRADSSYFYDAKSLKFVFTGAEWLDKEMQYIHVDLESETADVMPEGAEIAGCEREGNRWVLYIRVKMRGEPDPNHYAFHQVFLGTYKDPEGNDDYIRSWSSTVSWEGYEETPGYFYEVFPLHNYPYDEVWLEAHYSHTWEADTPASVTIDVE